MSSSRKTLHLLLLLLVVFWAAVAAQDEVPSSSLIEPPLPSEPVVVDSAPVEDAPEPASPISEVDIKEVETKEEVIVDVPAPEPEVKTEQVGSPAVVEEEKAPVEEKATEAAHEDTQKQTESAPSAESLFDTILDFFISLYDLLVMFISGTYESLANLGDGILGTIGDVTMFLGGKFFDATTTIFMIPVKIFVEITTVIWENLSFLTEGFSADFGNVFENVKNVLADIPRVFKSGFDACVEWICDFVFSILMSVSELVNSLFGGVGAGTDVLVKGFLDTINGIVSAITGAFTCIFDTVVEFWSGLFSSIFNRPESAPMEEGAKGEETSGESVFSGVFERIISMVTGFPLVVVNFVVDFANEFFTAARNAFVGVLWGFFEPVLLLGKMIVDTGKESAGGVLELAASQKQLLACCGVTFSSWILAAIPSSGIPIRGGSVLMLLPVIMACLHHTDEAHNDWGSLDAFYVGLVALVLGSTLALPAKPDSGAFQLLLNSWGAVTVLAYVVYRAANPVEAMSQVAGVLASVCHMLVALIAYYTATCSPQAGQSTRTFTASVPASRAAPPPYASPSRSRALPSMPPSYAQPAPSSRGSPSRRLTGQMLSPELERHYQNHKFAA
eukprot:comp21802_c0_seq1/m.31023 comp21802_c0_seq1/g.31023  ORF comp21802_c0_seq1/g.31023 comp21802_c0_seq1/m.31023 type:complete len:616 (-) comp21802_c0_seq1:22-1869(-)